MSFSTVRQNDDRWRSEAFGDAGETWASSACGLFAISIMLGLNTYSQIKAVYDYMKASGWVTDHSGTYQHGITDTLKHYGVGCVQTTPSSIGKKTGTSYMVHARQHVQKGGTLILLMGSATAGTALDNRFTSGGHYIDVIRYDSANDLYYVQDPAGRTTGWHPWDHFEGDVKHVFESEKTWTATAVKVEEGENMPIYKQLPQIRCGSEGMVVLLCQKILKSIGLYDGDLDGKFGKISERSVINYQTARNKQEGKVILTVDGIVGFNTWRDLLGGL